MELREYQARMVETIRAHWADGKKRVLGVLPTGGGKTETAIEIIRTDAKPTERALIVVDRKVLCQQWVDRMQRHGIDHVGILQGDNTRATWASILVATAQTIRARGVPEGVGLIVIDESHIWHQTHDEVLEALGDARVLGLSATPLRVGLGLRFDTVVIGATIKELIDTGLLVKARYFAPKLDAVNAALSRVSMRAGDFAANELSAAMSGKTIVGDVVGTWQERGEDRPTIAFCVDKEHARTVAAEFTDAGVGAAAIVDETKDEDRAELFAAFEAGAIRVLCSVGVLSIGFDSPIASCAIMARPTMSLSLYIQQGGRVLRPHPGKADALILDHAGNSVRHGLLEDFIPPSELSEIDQETDKAKRNAPAQAWICRHCEGVNALEDDICIECGEPRRSATTVVILDGDLVSVQHEPNDPPDGPTLDDVCRFYRMCMYYGQAKAMRNPTGWAYHATRRRFDIPEGKAKRVIDWGWRDLAPVPMDEACSRWLRADWQRQKIIGRYVANKRGSEACSV